MIVVLGRPGLSDRGALDRPAGRVARAAAGAGGRVELVGSVGDDENGEAVALELGRAGIGHAALLRDPAGVTPHVPDEDAEGGEAGPLPRLDAADVDLGLHYLADCHVLVVAEPLEAAAVAVATAATAYHGAALIVIAPAGTVPDALPDSATVLEMPDHDDGAFAELVGRYAASLENGLPAAEAWHAALKETGWESATE